METKLTKDLSVLTGISEQSLKKLADKSIYCICNSVEDLIYSRCDESRNTEGSGLGLAIAKSFVELQGGTFRIEIDGDLFKVIMKFKK